MNQKLIEVCQHQTVVAIAEQCTNKSLKRPGRYVKSNHNNKNMIAEIKQSYRKDHMTISLFILHHDIACEHN